MTTFEKNTTAYVIAETLGFTYDGEDYTIKGYYCKNRFTDTDSATLYQHKAELISKDRVELLFDKFITESLRKLTVLSLISNAAPSNKKLCTLLHKFDTNKESDMKITFNLVLDAIPITTIRIDKSKKCSITLSKKDGK